MLQQSEFPVPVRVSAGNVKCPGSTGQCTGSTAPVHVASVPGVQLLFILLVYCEYSSCTCSQCTGSTAPVHPVHVTSVPGVQLLFILLVYWEYSSCSYCQCTGSTALDFVSDPGVQLIYCTCCRCAGSTAGGGGAYGTTRRRKQCGARPCPTTTNMPYYK